MSCDSYFGYIYRILHELSFLLWLYIQDLTRVVILTLVIYTGSYMSCHSYFGYIYRILHELSFTINFYETSYIKLTTNVCSLLSSDPHRHTAGYAFKEFPACRVLVYIRCV